MARRLRYAALGLLTVLWGVGAVPFPVLRAVPFPLCITVAVLLDRGVSLRTIASLLGGGVVLELLWALPHGVIIGPQVCASAFMVLAERVFIIPPMVTVGSWRVSAVIVRMVLGTLSVVAGLSVWALGYSLIIHQPLLFTVRSVGDVSLWAGTAVTMLLTIVIFHHMRVPLRKRIIFGSPYA